jgi:hypothetical protein
MAKEKKDRSVARSFVDVINGNFLTRDDVLYHLPYVMYLSLLALAYIANGYLAEDTVRKLNRSNKEVKELRSEYITTKSELMYKSKQSQLAEFIAEKGMGLEESYEPPKKIVVEPEKWQPE